MLVEKNCFLYLIEGKWGNELKHSSINPIPGRGHFMYVGRGWCKITLNRKIKGKNQLLTELTKIHHHYKNIRIE